MSTTRKERVLAALEQAVHHGQMDSRMGTIISTPDGWVDGYALCSPGLGGSEALRRLRELRADGHDIEMRAHPVHGRTARQYRIRIPVTLLDPT